LYLKFIFTLLSFSCIINLYSQSVDFTFSTSNNLFCSPQTVTFTQNCSGTPDAFFWDFGNGQIANAPSQNITYSTAGTYTISLTAIYASNVISVSKTIVINQPPTVSLSANTNYICQPGNITFTANASPNTTNYTWNFGDGTALVNSTTNTITHNFTTYNNFIVTVTAFTASGCKAVTNSTVEVKKMPITATVSPTSGCIPATVSFNAIATLPAGDAVSSYTWNYGNGNNATTILNNTSTIYNTTTTINTANVTITSLQGCTQTYNFPSLAFGTPPFNTTAITITNRDTFCGSETLAFKATATNATHYFWNFGDGSSITTIDTFITHQYATIGNKQVIVTPEFNGCKGQPDTINVVIEGVIANFSFSNSCTAKNTFQFLNSSIGNVSKYKWNFNNITLDSVNYSTTYTYPNSGVFNTQLMIYDFITGCSDTAVEVQYTATPSLVSNSAKICKDSTLILTVLNPYSASSGFIYIFNVSGTNFNNGSSTVFQSNPNTFGNFTNYVVAVNPSNNTCNDTILLNNTTLVAGPNVQFITDTVNKCSNLLFPFTNQSFAYVPTDSIIKWQWQFGDNATDSVQQPLPKKYINGGNYIVTLTATDKNNCKQKFNLPLNVFPVPYLKAFPASDTICQGQNLMINAYTNDTLTWLPLTNISCSTCDTTFVQPTVSTNYIALSKNSYGCTSTDTVSLTVITPLSINIQPIDTSVCPGQFVAFRNNVPAKYTWLPSTYLSAATIANPTAIVDNTITYTVIGTDSLNCFSDTALVTVNTFTPPTVNAGNDTILNYNTPFTLQPTLSNNISNVLWSPNANNLNCTTCINPSGTALLSTQYTVNVTSTDGCKASDSVLIRVQCSDKNIYVPNAFSPNNDGLNDYFYPLTRGYKTINQFTVYNRWGQKVFDKKNFTPNVMLLGWDGKYKNQLLNDTQGLVWYIEATCDLGQRVTKKGTVVLLK
jgi:gliding motility-associated-like protein